MKKFTITKPDDWHLHLRDDVFLNTTVPAVAKYFARALIMPNLKPPVTTLAEAIDYQQRIKKAIPIGANFQPLMALYLTENTSAITIKQAKESDITIAAKFYPAGATTHSVAGVKNLENIYAALAAMEEYEFPLCVHAETTEKNVDIFDREQYFLENTLALIIKKFPRLRIVVEHVSSAFGVAFVKSFPNHIAATITAHHLLLNRNDLLVGGLHPHHYCLPVVKTEKDREALIAAATSGNPKFFLGTDSAPHAQSHKESICGSAGIFTGHAALELYAEVFEQAGALDKLEGFASIYGADFYSLPRNQATITLSKESWHVPNSFTFGNELLIPFRAGETINWKVIP